MQRPEDKTLDFLAHRAAGLGIVGRGLESDDGGLDVEPRLDKVGEGISVAMRPEYRHLLERNGLVKVDRINSGNGQHLGHPYALRVLPVEVRLSRTAAKDCCR